MASSRTWDTTKTWFSNSSYLLYAEASFIYIYIKVAAHRTILIDYGTLNILFFRGWHEVLQPTYFESIYFHIQKVDSSAPF